MSHLTTPDARITWFGLATIWFGGIISVPALLIGSLLISGLRFWPAVGLGFAGFSVVAIVMSLLGYRAAQRRLDTVTLAASAFGVQGARWVIGMVIGVSLLGWFGVQTSIAGASLARIVEMSAGVKLGVPAVSFAMGLMMMVTAVFGFGSLKWLNYVAVPAKVVLVAYGVTAAFQAHSFDVITAYQPDPAKALNPWSAIGIAMGFIAAAGVIAPDYARNVLGPRHAVIGALLGLLPSATMLAACGAMLAVLYGAYDIVDIYARLGYPVLALSILIVATWTVNVINIYSAGLAFNGLLGGRPERRWAVTLSAGIAGALLAAAGILDSLVAFLSTLTLTVMPIAGVMIAALYLRRQPPVMSAPAPRWDARGLVSWLAGAGGMFAVEHPIRNLLGFVAAAICFVVLHACGRSRPDRAEDRKPRDAQRRFPPG